MALALYHDTYRCTGENPNPPEMLMLHGWGLHSQVWDGVMPALLEKFQVTVVDLPGFGRSPMPGGDYNLDYLTQHVLAVAPEKAVWVGWSLGGMVAMNAAIQAPERLSGLVTVASTPKFVSGDGWPLAMNPKVLEKFRALLLEDWEGTLIRFLALQCKDSDTLKDDIRTLKAVVYFHGSPSLSALKYGLDVLRDVDLLNDLHKIKTPTLHLLGKKDNLIPVGISETLKQRQPEADVVMMDGASHVPFLSAPEKFTDHIMAFLSENGLV